MLGNRTHAIFLVLLVDIKAWEVFDWTAWAALYRERMTQGARKASFVVRAAMTLHLQCSAAL